METGYKNNLDYDLRDLTKIIIYFMCECVCAILNAVLKRLNVRIAANACVITRDAFST